MGRMRCATHANERQTIILDGFRLLLLLLLRCQRGAGAGGAIIGHQEEGITLYVERCVSSNCRPDGEVQAGVLE